MLTNNSLQSLPNKKNEGIIIDIESLDAGDINEDDLPLSKRNSTQRRSQFSNKRSLSLTKLEMEETMNRSMDHIETKSKRSS